MHPNRQHDRLCFKFIFCNYLVILGGTGTGSVDPKLTIHFIVAISGRFIIEVLRQVDQRDEVSPLFLQGTNVLAICLVQN